MPSPNKGVVGDISDVWQNLDGFSEGFKSASSGLDGKQYFVPFYFYPWGVHYRKSLFEENGYAIPANWDEFKALCDQMQTDGLTPLAGANDGRWPQMGMFDMLNLRINGYDFHVSLMGGNEDWTSDQVKAVFAAWEEILPYYQPDANGRTWQDAANGIGDKSSGMFLLGTFITSQLRQRHPAGHHRRHRLLPVPRARPGARPGRDRGTDRRVHDGGRRRRTRRAPRRCSPASAASTRSTPTSRVNPSVVAANDGADTASYNALQQKSVEAVGIGEVASPSSSTATPTPTSPPTSIGQALADFIANPGRHRRDPRRRRGQEADATPSSETTQHRDHPTSTPTTRRRRRDPARRRRRYSTLTGSDRIVAVGDGRHPRLPPHRAGVDPGPAHRRAVVHRVGQPRARSPTSARSASRTTGSSSPSSTATCSPPLFNNFVLIFWLTICSMVGMLFAYLLDKNMRGSRIYQSIYYFPVVLSLAVVGFIWKSTMFSRDRGLLNIDLARRAGRLRRRRDEAVRAALPMARPRRSGCRGTSPPC